MFKLWVVLCAGFAIASIWAGSMVAVAISAVFLILAMLTD